MSTTKMGHDGPTWDSLFLGEERAMASGDIVITQTDRTVVISVTCKDAETANQMFAEATAELDRGGYIKLMTL